MTRLRAKERDHRYSVVKDMFAEGHNAHKIAKATGWPYSWCYTAVQAIKNNAVPNYGSPSRRSELKPLLARMTRQDFLDNPPASLKEAQTRIMQETGYAVTLVGVRDLFNAWHLPLPAPRRGRGYKAAPKPNPALEALRSELRILCLQHVNQIPTHLILELLP